MLSRSRRVLLFDKIPDSNTGLKPAPLPNQAHYIPVAWPRARAPVCNEPTRREVRLNVTLTLRGCLLDDLRPSACPS